MTFSYVMPDGEKFLKALIIVLRSQEDHALASLLSDSKLVLVSSGTYAPYAGGTIFNAYATTANFAIPLDKYEAVTQSIGAEVALRGPILKGCSRRSSATRARASSSTWGRV